MRKAIALSALLGLVSFSAAGAQTLPRPVWTGLSPRAAQQLDDVSKAMGVYADPERAAKDGFVPILGWIPTMGTHWVNNARMLREGKKIDIKSPVQLMYSTINGKPTLVGAAYSYLTSLNDSTHPASFDGNPMWHEHPDLAPAGMRLVMLHVWFVPSPDGPYAGHNPNLPYWAMGVTPPDPARMKDPAEDALIRKTALALAVVADTDGLFPQLHRRPAVLAAEKAHGDSIRALIPELDAAAKAQNWAQWDRAADRAAAQWDTLTKVWLDAVLVPANKEKIQRFIREETTGMHDMPGMHH